LTAAKRFQSGARYSTSEVQQLHEEMREKQEAFDSMKKEMESYAKMQQFSQQADDSTDPAQAIIPPLRLCVFFLI